MLKSAQRDGIPPQTATGITPGLMMPGIAWAQQNGMWVFGVNNPFAVLDAFKAYGLAPVAKQIKSDVLILAGDDNHFVPNDQMGKFRQSLTNAHSVTAISFNRLSGDAEHCKLGAPSLWQAALFDWINSTYPTAQ